MHISGDTFITLQSYSMFVVLKYLQHLQENTAGSRYRGITELLSENILTLSSQRRLWEEEAQDDTGLGVRTLASETRSPPANHDPKFIMYHLPPGLCLPRGIVGQIRDNSLKYFKT